MRKLHRTSLFGLVVLASMLAAGAASATSYTDFLTRWDLPNQGYVSDRGGISYEHSLTPAGDTEIDSVSAVYLSVLVGDDVSCRGFIFGCHADSEGEFVEIPILDVGADGDVQASFNFLWGNVTLEAQVQGWGDSFQVDILSSRGDFVVWKSAAKFIYDSGAGHGGGIPAVPEPTAAAVFALGSVLVAGTARRRRPPTA
jgi:hypothetical protein